MKNIKTELGMIQEVTIESNNLLYSEVVNDIPRIKEEWPRFEASFPSLTGRKMLGLEYTEENRFRVCSEVREEDKGEKFGLQVFVFEGGLYARLRLKFDPPELYEKISPGYKSLIKEYDKQIDWKRPFIEYYKSENVLDIMVPITH